MDLPSNEQVEKTCPPQQVEHRLSLAKPHLQVLSCRPAGYLPK